MARQRHKTIAAGGKAVAVDELVFERAPERFHGGVVVAVAFATHRGDAAVSGEDLAISGAHLLAAAVGVVEDTDRGLALAQRHLEGRKRKCRP